jgi:hypothetical protein
LSVWALYLYLLHVQDPELAASAWRALRVPDPQSDGVLFGTGLAERHVTPPLPGN